MNVVIVGGRCSPDPLDLKHSSIVDKLASDFSGYTLFKFNGDILPIHHAYIETADLVIWMPDIPNNIPKKYPVKRRGSILICSKFIHDEVTDTDAVSKIFKMHGNAVISIRKQEDKLYSFKLIDALGNVWTNTTDISELSKSILRFYEFVTSSKRIESISLDSYLENERKNEDLLKFLELNKRIADKSEQSGGRYFGNCSTRCEKGFPSMRCGSIVWVSKRNVDKERITVEDMVPVLLDPDEKVVFIGNSKPSVDTPVQLSIYKNFQNINYIIHGHRYIENVGFTENYRQCGDILEYYEVLPFIRSNTTRINLMGHGFLIWSRSLNKLESYIDQSVFIKRNIGDEPIRK